MFKKQVALINVNKAVDGLSLVHDQLLDLEDTLNEEIAFHRNSINEANKAIATRMNEIEKSIKVRESLKQTFQLGGTK